MTFGDRMWVAMFGALILTNVVEAEWIRWFWLCYAVVMAILFIVDNRRTER